MCHNCGTVGHKSSECRKLKGEKRWCSHCKSASHNDSVCRKKHTKTVKNDNDNHSYAFKVNDDLYLETEENEKLLIDCIATTRIVNFDNFGTTDKSFKPEEHFMELTNGSMSINVAKKKGTVQITFYTTDGKPVKIKIRLKTSSMFHHFLNASSLSDQQQGRERKCTLKATTYADSTRRYTIPY